MKHAAVIASLLMTLVLAGGLSAGKKSPAMMHGAMTMCDDGMRGVCPMHGMMMRSMLQSSMAVTPDGGVVVRQGSRLVKYDKDLNLVKEVELKTNLDSLEKTMRGMMENCPSYKEMLKSSDTTDVKKSKPSKKK